MATILFAWELGGGLGHIARHKPIAELLVAKGHRVYFALRDLRSFQQVFRNTGVECLQAPFKIGKPQCPVHQPRTFPHILHNVGFEHPDELLGLVRSWRSIYGLLKPDVVVIDHGPTALLALRGVPAKRVLVGTGFVCPPDTYPMPDLRPWLPSDQCRLEADEDRVLSVTNDVLRECGQGPINRIGQLFSEVDDQALVTFPELDHYGARSDVAYWGTWWSRIGDPPSWPPDGKGRVFAYLKPFAALPALLESLCRHSLSTLVFCPSIPQDLKRRFSSGSLRFSEGPVDLDAASGQCDLVILNGTHGASTQMLLTGRPILSFPILLEQLLVARNIEKIGAGLFASIDRPEQTDQKLEAMLESHSFTESAQGFAKRYAFVDPRTQVAKLAHKLEQIAAVC